MIVKMFGYDQDYVHTIYVELPEKLVDTVNKLQRDGKLICVHCGDTIFSRDTVYTYSQLHRVQRRISYHLACEDCTAPVKAAIEKVINDARDSKQARPTQEEATAAPVGTGGAP